MARPPSPESYVPPPPDEMGPALDAFEVYLHGDDEQPRLVRLAFIHQAQGITITGTCPMTDPADRLRSIKTFDDLARYLEDELDWPLEQYGFEELTFEYSPAELGLKDEDAAKVKAIHQLRPPSPALPP